MTAVERARKLYEEFGAPMIRERFPDYEGRFAVGLAGEGSECFGWDDAISRDHDYGPGFCLWLTEEDEIEVSRQNEKIGQINKQIADKKNQLDSLRRSAYRGLITDEAFILSEQESLEKDISHLEAKLNEVKTVASNWREVALDVFMFARYAKEDFDSDDWGTQKASNQTARRRP